MHAMALDLHTATTVPLLSWRCRRWLACVQCPRTATASLPRCRTPAFLAAAVMFVPSRGGVQSQAPLQPMLLLLRMLLPPPLVPPHPPALPHHHRRAHPHAPATPGLNTIDVRGRNECKHHEARWHDRWSCSSFSCGQRQCPRTGIASSRQMVNCTAVRIRRVL